MGCFTPLLSYTPFFLRIVATLHSKLFLGEFHQRRYETWQYIIAAFDVYYGLCYMLDELQRYMDYGTVCLPRYVMGVLIVVLSLVDMYRKVDINEEERHQHHHHRMRLEEPAQAG